jgi:hypothetical protein
MEIHENQFHKMIGPPVRATAFGTGEGREKRRCHPRTGKNAKSGRPDVFDPEVNVFPERSDVVLMDRACLPDEGINGRLGNGTVTCFGNVGGE